ncbi:phosphatase PAP2 family protein [Hymenobacter profundi]|uniref:Phosphatase PAP2 family protein n=1 Tax=Hymenobacter profundi TaxID=1982110 RepID=A0ABS6X108_9BACT|nr:phosphatase PAP2 family protein [Hymenobacter profundi]MBW3129519.1 phosphatase PAP2 family protein [Hymenobacter profundi]
MRKRLHKRLTTLAELITLEVALAGLFFLLAFGVFFYLTRIVFVQHSAAFDDWAFAQLDALRAAAPWLTACVRGITFFASMPFLVAAALLIPGFLLWRQQRREALMVFLAVVGATVFNQLLKLHFQRTRPGSALIPQPGLSFPSGHAMIGSSLYAALAWLAWRHGQRGLAVGLLVWAALIGLTRVYLHVHYATDVTAGFAAGVVWMLVLRIILRWRKGLGQPG